MVKLKVTVVSLSTIVLCVDNFMVKLKLKRKEVKYMNCNKFE